MYLSYEEYSAFGGKIIADEFDRLSFKAGCEINNATLGRCKELAEIPEEVKRCEFDLIEYFSKNTHNGITANVASFSNDGYSVSFSEEKTVRSQIKEIIYSYLADTDLLYCGVG